MMLATIKLSALPAPVLVLGSVFSVQFGQAIGKTLFDSLSPNGVVSLRLGVAALLLLILFRPRCPKTLSLYFLTFLFGMAIAGMNLVYMALQYLPVSVAATIQLLGPLTVALLSSRSRMDLAWSLMAIIGVILFLSPNEDAKDLPAIGIFYAALSGVSMGCYVLLSRRVGQSFSGGGGLAIAVTWAALLYLPFGVLENNWATLPTSVWLWGCFVAVLSAAIPYFLELTALRYIPPKKVGVLQSLEPAVGCVAGLIILGETLNMRLLTAIFLITLASIGSVLVRRDKI